MTQPPPKPSQGDCWLEVLEDMQSNPPTKPSEIWPMIDVFVDMKKRRAFGAEKYGTVLQPHNGRDFPEDLYQELLDAVVYAKGCILEGKSEYEPIYRELLALVVKVRGMR